MAEAVGNLRANLTADWADFRAELDRSGQALGQFGEKFGGVAGRITRAAVGLFAGVQIGRFISDSVQAAIAAQELEGAFSAAFGNAADSANAWAEQLSDDLGRSETAVRQMALGFQNLFGEIAPTNEAASEASQRFTQLAIDFAALKSIPTQDAFRAIQQGLSGSSRALRAYGVDLSENAVRQEALRTGVIQNNEELSNEQAVLVRASIIMREFGDATGAASEQTGSAAAEQERLRARLEETKTQLGDALLPTITAVQGALAGLLEAWNDLWRGLGRAIERNDQMVIRLYQLKEALRGNFLSYESVAGALAQVRAEQRAGADAATQQRDEIRGLSDETTAYADSLTNLAGTLQNGGARGPRGRSWAEQHAGDIERLRQLIDPAGAAIRSFTRDMEIAQRAGLDMGQAQVQLARDLIEAAGGVEVFKNVVGELPDAFQRAIQEMGAEDLAESIQRYRDELKDFADELTRQFAPESALEERLARIDEAFREGLITIDVYKAAIAEATGANEQENKLSEYMRQQAEERERSWSRLRSSIADVAQGTRDAGDAAKQFVLAWLRAQWIEPFLERLFSNKGVFGGGGGGGILGSIGNFILGGFGGGKADGGRVIPGMTYMVGERGRELFVPDEAGSIVANDRMGGTVVNQYIQTPDLNSFYASRRQLARQQRLAAAL